MVPYFDPVSFLALLDISCMHGLSIYLPVQALTSAGHGDSAALIDALAQALVAGGHIGDPHAFALVSENLGRCLYVASCACSFSGNAITMWDALGPRILVSAIGEVPVCGSFSWVAAILLVRGWHSALCWLFRLGFQQP